MRGAEPTPSELRRSRYKVFSARKWQLSAQVRVDQVGLPLCACAAVRPRCGGGLWRCGAGRGVAGQPRRRPISLDPIRSDLIRSGGGNVKRAHKALLHITPSRHGEERREGMGGEGKGAVEMSDFRPGARPAPPRPGHHDAYHTVWTYAGQPPARTPVHPGAPRCTPAQPADEQSPRCGGHRHTLYRR